MGKGHKIYRHLIQLDKVSYNVDKFYVTGKLHKFPTFGTVDQLPARPIISNIGTAFYLLAKYLAKLLLPLSKN